MNQKKYTILRPKSIVTQERLFMKNRAIGRRVLLLKGLTPEETAKFSRIAENIT